MGKVEQRVFEIERKFADIVDDVRILFVHEDFFKIILFLKDGSTLRTAEDWSGKVLNSYSYYWLDNKNNLIVGWDNAPHHKKAETFPHHKHIGISARIAPSYEKSLEAVLETIRIKLK